MKFLDNSQTNWRYILIVTIIAAVVGGGILGYQWWIEKQEGEMSEFRMPESGEYISEKECTEEGELKCTVMGCKPCCSGLVNRYVKNPMRTEENEVVCIEEMTMIRCVRCTDGICGEGENWCICPEDCEKPNPEDLELSF